MFHLCLLTYILAPNSQILKPIAKIHILVKKKKTNTLIGLFRNKHFIPNKAFLLKPLILLFKQPQSISNIRIKFNIFYTRTKKWDNIQKIQ